MVSLNGIAEHMEGVRKLNAQDEQLLALGQGWAHAATHSIYFYYRWAFSRTHIPVSHTAYPKACSCMSIVQTCNSRPLGDAVMWYGNEASVSRPLNKR